MSATISYTRLFISGLISWLLGVTTYFLFLFAFYSEAPEEGDLQAVLAWSFFAALLALPLVYYPLLVLVRKLLGSSRPVIVFPLVSSLAFIIPSMLIIWMSSTSTSNFLRGLISSEAFLFYCLFLTVGISFGLGFVWSSRERDDERV
jgi:hypothetical protein